MTNPRRIDRSSTLALAVTVAVCTLLVTACSDDHDGDEVEPATGTPSSAPSQYGSSMGVVPASAAEIGALGPGPQPGDTWEIPVGLNVCGRFLDPLTTEPFEIAGVTLSAGPDGFLTLEGGPEVTGTPLVGDFADAVGIELRTGSITFPDDTTPAEIDTGGAPLDVAASTFTDGDGCGGSEATVQVWVYPDEAVRSGEGIRLVTEGPHLVPISQAGMAVVVAFSPASSLPTLPPSAMTR